MWSREPVSPSPPGVGARTGATEQGSELASQPVQRQGDMAGAPGQWVYAVLRPGPLPTWRWQKVTLPRQAGTLAQG